jgi:hypothetical protein
MTLVHEGITDGSVLYIGRCRRRGARHARFRLSVGETGGRRPAASGECEESRLADLIWAGWEMARAHDRMCAVMHARQAQRQRQWSESEGGKTNVDPAKEIASDPLPTPGGEENGKRGPKEIRETVGIDE